MPHRRRPCSISGCGKLEHDLGWCGMHAARWRKYGDVGPAHALKLNPTVPCSVDGCARESQSKGWCKLHYERHRRHGSLTLPEKEAAPPKPAVPCAVEGCVKLARSRGWCPAHYERWRRNGDPGVPGDARRREPQYCTVDGCEKRTCGRGLCRTHWARWKAHGDPTHAVRNYGTYRRVMDGYVYLWMPGHPLAVPPGYVAEHRLVMWDAGLLTQPDRNIHVHHKNRDTSDNRIENLEVLKAGEHHRTHLIEDGFVVNQYGTWPLRNL